MRRILAELEKRAEALGRSLAREKYAEYAPGIPEKAPQELPRVAKPQTWRLALQRHQAERAGEHLDLRLVAPDGKAHSWAIPFAAIPKPGDRAVLAVPQPTHTAEYATTFGAKRPGTIESGYGKGTVRLEKLVPVEVTHMDPDASTQVRFNLYVNGGPQEFAIVNTGKSTILVNKTMHAKRVAHLPLGDKPKLKERDPAKIDVTKATEVVMPKYDGAHTLLDLPAADKKARIYSYRIPKKTDSGVLEHTHKVDTLGKIHVPKEHEKTTLRAELIAVDKKTGKALPAHVLGGMLNAQVPRSREMQEELGAKLLPVAFDVVRHRGKDLSAVPFADRLELLKRISKDTGVRIAETATTPGQKKKLIDAVTSGKHKLTGEGFVVKELWTDEAAKAKFRPDHDVYVREIFGAVGKDGATLDRAGGFTYSHTPSGPIVGNVGTGFSHDVARDMLAHPEKYKGRVAKVTAEKKFESGALSKPAFIDWHIEKGRIE